MNRQNINLPTNQSSFWQILVILLLFVGIFSLVILLMNPESAQAKKLKALRESVQSEMVANYSIDIARGFVPQISLSLVKEIISDRVPAEDADEEFNAFMLSLQTLVPTVTPDPSMLLLNPLSPEPTSSLTLTTTLTTSPTIAITLTDTETATLTPSATSTPWIVTYTWTPWPTEGGSAPIVPTRTRTPTVEPTSSETPSPEPTATVEEPTKEPPKEPATPVVPTVEKPKPTPTPTPEPAPTKEPRPTKVPKDTKEPKEDKAEEPLELSVPMLASPVVIK